MSVADVYALLQGATDEHKFAGLALLPRVCASDALVEYRNVYEAISLDFIWRLLVPLRDPRFIATIDGIEDVQKQLLGVKIALSVLSLLSRDEGVANDPQLFELIPCLTRLVRAPALAAACGKGDVPSDCGSDPADVHKDALELLWNMCNSAEEAAAIARQSCTVSAASEWLRNNFMVQPASSSQLCLCLMFTVLRPCLNPPLDKREQGFPLGSIDHVQCRDFLQEAVAAVGGIASMCAVDCSEKTAINDASSVVDRLDRMELGGNMGPNKVEAQSVQLEGFSILAAVIPCLLSNGQTHPQHAWSATLTWAEDLRVAVHRALRSRLPLNHLLHVLSALGALVELQGAVGLLFSTNHSRQSYQGFTSLLALVVQVSKVHVHSHLQGCVLHVSSSGGMLNLSDHLQLSEAVFTMALRLSYKVIDLVMIIEEAHEGYDDKCKSGTSVLQSVLVAANSEGILVEVLRALQDSASAMLEFIACLTGDTLDDGPKPEQIPKGFRAMSEVNSPEMERSHSQLEQAKRTSTGFVSEIASAFKASHQTGISLMEEQGWAHRTLKACCHSVGMLLSLTGGAENCTQLLNTLPNLCSWIIRSGARHEAVTLKEQVQPVESLMSALYSMHTLHVGGGTVADACSNALNKPEVFMVVGTCCTMMMQHCQQADPQVDELWPSILSSQIVVGCELTACVIRTSSYKQRQSAEQLYMELRSHGFTNSPEAFLPGIVAASNNMQCALTAAIPANADSALLRGDNTATVVEVVAAVADVTVAALSMLEDLHACDISQPLCNTVGVVRLMLEWVLSAGPQNCDHLIQRLVTAAGKEPTCWGADIDHVLLPHINAGINVAMVVERCCSICASIVAVVETMPLLASQVSKATWLVWYLQDDAAFEELSKTLEETGASVSLGHALRMLAGGIQT